MTCSARTTIRLPESLGRALTARAEKLGRPVAVVARDAIAAELSKPIAEQDRSTVARFLEAAEEETTPCE